MGFKDYYEILGITTTKVTYEDIKNAYRNQAKKFHPDINTEDNDEKIKDINEAYKILSDAQKKKKYDRLWISYVGRNKKENKTYDYMEKDKTFNEEFSSIFFGNAFFQKKSQDEQEDLNVYINLKISIKEAYNGTEKTILYSGKEIPIKIPERVANYTQIRIKHLGKRDKSKIRMPGDLIITLDIQDSEKYTIKGLDIVKKLYVTPAQVVLGAKIEEEVFDENYLLVIPKNISNFKKTILKGKGLKKNNTHKGNLIFEVIIKIPENISEEEIELYKRIKELEKSKETQE